MIRARPILPWLVPSALALLAFAPVLGMWFVADDFGHLLFNLRLPFPQSFLSFNEGSLFYRPLSTALTWNLGTAIFGTNAFPYHLISLLLHALAAFLVARLGYVVSGSKYAGLAAGSIFAVYPLTTEPVAWLASQWDLLGAVCVLGAALGFAVAWQRSLKDESARSAYLMGLASAFLMVSMKESTLPMPAVLPFIAVAVTAVTRTSKTNAAPRAGNEEPTLSGIRPAAFVRKVALWCLPYAVPSLLFVGIRLAAGAGIGGYPNAPTDFQHFFWDALAGIFLTMLMPLNRLLFSRTLVQILGMAMTALLAVSLVLWGRRRWPVLLLAIVWWIVFLLPAINLVPLEDNRANITNRVYYLSLIGFCMALGALLSVPLEWQRPRFRAIGLALSAVFLLLAVPITWKQLEPWVQSSRQTRHLLTELDTLLPARSAEPIELNANDLPREYYGAYVFWNGINDGLEGFDGQPARVNEVNKMSAQALVEPLGNRSAIWNVDFAFRPDSRLYFVQGLEGVSRDIEPPAQAGTLVWDFRACHDGLPVRASLRGADLECRGDYAAVVPNSPDPGITLSDVDIDLTGVRWLRLGASVEYTEGSDARLGEWYWTGDDRIWSEERSLRYNIAGDGEPRVYWTYLDVTRVGTRLSGLRFDPVNSEEGANLRWIAVTPIAPTR